jgi:hypothetical protein
MKTLFKIGTSVGLAAITLVLVACGGGGMQQNPLKNYASLNNAVPPGGTSEAPKYFLASAFDIVAVDEKGQRWSSVSKMPGESSAVLLEVNEGSTKTFTFSPEFASTVDGKKVIYKISQVSDTPAEADVKQIASGRDGNLVLTLHPSNKNVPDTEPFAKYTFTVKLDPQPGTPKDVVALLGSEMQRNFEIRVYKQGGAAQAPQILDPIAQNPNSVLRADSTATISFQVSAPTADDVQSLSCVVLQTNRVPSVERNIIDGHLGVVSACDGRKIGDHLFEFQFTFDARTFLRAIKDNHIQLVNDAKSDAPADRLIAEAVFQVTDIHTDVATAKVAQFINVSPNSSPGNPVVSYKQPVGLTQAAGPQSFVFHIKADNDSGDISIATIDKVSPTNGQFALTDLPGNPQIACATTNQVLGDQTCIGNCVAECTINWNVDCSVPAKTYSLPVVAITSSGDEKSKPKTVSISVPIERDSTKCPSTVGQRRTKPGAKS